MRFSRDAVDEARRKDAEGPKGGGERWGRYGRPLKPGTYPCEVVDAGTDTGPNIGEYVTLVVRVDAPASAAPEGPVKVDYRVTAAFKAINLAEVWPDRVREDADGLEVDGPALVGARGRCVVGLDKPYNGEQRLEIKRFLAAEGAAAPSAARHPTPPRTRSASDRPGAALSDDELPF